MALPSIEDLKPHVNITSSTDDDELTDMLDAALDIVSGIVGQLDEASVTETHYGVSSSVLVLRQMPVSAVTSIGYSWFGGTPVTVSSSDYVLDPATGIVRLVSGGRFAGDVTVTYTAGSAVLPAAIRLAVLIIAAHLFETQRMPGQSTDSAPAGFGGLDGIPDAGSMGTGYAIPRRAQELLQPYTRPAIA